MLYTEDFTMRHYVGFSQIGSHMIIVMLLLGNQWSFRMGKVCNS